MKAEFKNTLKISLTMITFDFTLEIQDLFSICKAINIDMM